MRHTEFLTDPGYIAVSIEAAALIFFIVNNAKNALHYKAKNTCMPGAYALPTLVAFTAQTPAAKHDVWSIIE